MSWSVCDDDDCSRPFDMTMEWKSGRDSVYWSRANAGKVPALAEDGSESLESFQE